jgi:hypothetical protein
MDDNSSDLYLVTGTLVVARKLTGHEKSPVTRLVRATSEADARDKFRGALACYEGWGWEHPVEWVVNEKAYKVID